MSTQSSAFIPAPCAPVVFERNAVTQSAFDRVLPAARALPPEMLMRITVDIASAVNTARAGAQRVQQMREIIARELPLFDVTILSTFEDTIDALVHAQAIYTVDAGTEEQPKDITPLVDECTRLRNNAVTDLLALVTRNAIDAATVEAIKDGSGYEDLAMDLVAVDEALTRARGVLGDRMWITLDEQAYIRGRGTALRAELASRNVNNSDVRDRVEIRQRMFTLFARRYDQLRRAATYLRWEEGDADSVVPSIFAKAKRPRGEAEAKPADNKPSEEKPADNKPAPMPVLDTDSSRPVPQDSPYGNR